MLRAITEANIAGDMVGFEPKPWEEGVIAGGKEEAAAAAISVTREAAARLMV